MSSSLSGVGASPRRSVVVVGSCNIDLIAYVPRLPVLGETLIGTGFAKGLGGKGANQAVAAAKLAAGGATVTMVGAVGDDAFGAEYEAALRAAGAAPLLRVVPGAPTGVAPIAVAAGGGNSIIVVPGANAALAAADVAAAPAAAAIAAAGVVLCQLEVGGAATAAALAAARAAGALAVLTPAPAPPAGLPAELYAAADLLLPNRGEALALAAALDGGGAAAALPADDDAAVPMRALVAAARRLLRGAVQAVVVTCGARGCLVVTAADAPQFVPAAAPPAVLDTTGAGDAFAGALGFFYAQLAPAAAADPPLRLHAPTLVEACRRAAVVAAASVARRGTQASYPSRGELPAAVFERCAPAAVGDGAASAGDAAWQPRLPEVVPADTVEFA